MDRSSRPPLPSLPPTHVPRPRLVDAVGEGARIVCVVGGPGWGKTVLLHELAARAPGPVLRIGPSGGPGTSRSPWADGVRATTALARSEDRTLHALVEQADAAVRSLAVTAIDGWFARDLADHVGPVLRDAAATLVTDDLHLFDRTDREAWWTFVERVGCDGGPVRFLMAARHEGAFPLAAWRLREDVLVVDESTLAYELAEIDAVAAHLTGSRPAGEVIAAIAESTEGWPTGVHRHALGLLLGHHTPVDEPVLRSAVDDLAPDVRRFVLDTCVLDELTPAGCSALSGRTDAGAVLHRLWQDGVFTVRLDTATNRYRYRRPFRDLLHADLRASDTSRWEELHRTAAAHLLEHGAVGAAATHLVDIGDHEGALSLLLHNHATVMETAQHLELAPLLERVPMPVVGSDAQRTFALGFLLASSGHIAAGRRMVDTLDETDLDPELRHRVRWVRLIVACSLGDVSDDDLEHLPPEPPDRAIATFWRELPIALVLDDRFAETDAVWADGVRAGLPTSADTLLQSTTEIFLGAWRGRIREVVPDTTEAEEDLRDARHRLRAAYVRIAITRAMIETELGDPMDAVERLEGAAAEFEGRVIPFTTHDVPLFRTIVRALRLAGRTDHALARGLEFERAIDPSRVRLRRLISEEVVRSACASGDLATATRARRELTGPCAGPLADAWIAIATHDLRAARSAVAALDLTDLVMRAPSRALDVLEVRARTASTPRELHDLVTAASRLADEHGLARSFESGIGSIAGIASVGPVGPVGSIVGTSRPAEPSPLPLSDRELDVLRGLASGLPHRQLAVELDVSHNTLKTHLRAVYRKLGALDRDDAVLRARSAGLLSLPSDVVGR